MSCCLRNNIRIRMDGTEVGVESVKSVGNGTVALSISAPEGFDPHPGQFVQVARDVDGENVVRHYTLSSAYVDGTFEITVEVDPEGELSPVLASLGESDTVSVDGPYGRSYYEKEKNVVVLAGGPGIGPAVGIGERVANETGGENVGIVYRDSKPAHKERLDALRAEGATIEVVGEGDSLAGPMEEILEAVGTGAQVFVYGFEGFVDESRDVLKGVGYEGEPKVENFG